MDHTTQETFTSIEGYDKGWEILVDGKPSISGAAADKAFLCTAMEPGIHNIVFQYTAPLSNAGMVTTAVCLVLFLILLMKYYQNTKKSSDTKADANRGGSNEEN